MAAVKAGGEGAAVPACRVRMLTAAMKESQLWRGAAVTNNTADWGEAGQHVEYL